MAQKLKLGLPADQVRKMIVDQNLVHGDQCPGQCGGHLEEVKDEDGVKWLQCSQNDDHYATAPVD